MKKLHITAIFLLLSILSTAQNGKVRVSFIGFDCLRETWDDAMQLDGKGDEVFLNFNITIAQKDGTTLFNYQRMTDTYGDNSGTFSNRINAGSCTDLFGNNRGGLKAGDKYRGSVLIGEFNLNSGDIVTVIPGIWEWDPAQDIVSSVINGIESKTNELNRKIAGIVNTLTPSFANFVIDGSKLDLPGSSDIIQNIIGKQGSRPIGMTTEGVYFPRAVVLNPAFIQMAITSDFGYGRGVIPVSYNEELIGNGRDHGNYVILLSAEFIPSSTTGTTTVVAPASGKVIMNTTTATFQTVTPVQTSDQTSSGMTTTTSTSTSNTGTQSTGVNSSDKKGKPQPRPIKR